MAYILFVFLFGAAGPHVEAAPFDSLDECEATRAKVYASIAEYNAKASTAKIDLFATSCVATKKAPQGKDV